MNTKLAAVLFTSAFAVMARESLADTFTTSPGACSQGNSLLSIYAGRGASGNLSKKHWVIDHFTGWEDLSPAAVPSPGSQVACVSYPFNEVMHDGVCALYGGSIKCHMWSNTNGDTFTTPVTDSISSPALITILTGVQIRLVLFWINTAGQVRYREYHPSSNFWNIPGTLPGSPTDLASIAAAHRYGPHWMQLCGITSGGTTMRCVTRQGLINSVAWEVNPGSYGGNPAVAFSQAGSFFVINAVSRSSFDTQPWFTNKVFGWSNPLPLGGQFNSSLAMTSWGGSTLHIFGRGLDNNIWFTWFDNGSWAGNWYPL